VFAFVGEGLLRVDVKGSEMVVESVVKVARRVRDGVFGLDECTRWKRWSECLGLRRGVLTVDVLGWSTWSGWLALYSMDDFL
jgi:hypothetical protein